MYKCPNASHMLEYVPLPILLHTFILINEWLPKDLANLVVMYFQTKDRSAYQIGIAGEYETCSQLPKVCWKNALQGAYRKGYMQIIEMFIERECVSDYFCFQSACQSGDIKVVDYAIKRNAERLLRWIIRRMLRR